MEVFLIFLVICVVSALTIAWIVIKILSLMVRIAFRLVGLPFKLAARADRAVALQCTRPPPRRVLRGDDILCSNRICNARLPAEAKFCARCGGALPRRRIAAPTLVVEVQSRGLTRVA